MSNSNQVQKLAVLLLLAAAVLALVAGRSFAAEQRALSGYPSTNSLSDAPQGPQAIDAYGIEIGPENSYIILENNDIRVKYEGYIGGEGNPEFSIREFRLKSLNADQVGASAYMDADANRYGLRKATIIDNSSTRKTVRLEWEPEGGSSQSIIHEVTIYPTGRFIEIKYVSVLKGLNIVDLGKPGGTVKGEHIAYGHDGWVRDYVTHHEAPEIKGSYYNRFENDGVNDPADGGSLNYKDHFILGVYNPANNLGYGRVMPVKDTHIIKLLLDPVARRGLEFFPYPFFKPHEPFTGYLFAVTGGAADVINYGKSIVDGTALEPPPPDNSAPVVAERNPAPGATDVPVDSNISFRITDEGWGGVLKNSVKVRVDGVDVSSSLQFAGSPSDYTVTYNPSQNFFYNATVNVEIDACDGAGNCMSKVSYSFSTPAGETVPPVISDVKVVPGPDFAFIGWTTDEPATSEVDYGTTAGYGKNESNTALVEKHGIVLRGLDPDREYHFRISTTDEAGNSAQAQDATFQTQPSIPAVSDDFNSCSLNGRWTFVNPLNDAGYTANGETVAISVPAGVAHDVWIPVNRAARLMQDATAFDELEVKFESGVSQITQIQGLLLEQDPENYLRVNLQREGTGTRLYVIGFAGGANPRIFKNLVFNGANTDGPLYLQVQRDANRWQVRYSNDGGSWSSTGWFSHPLSVTQVGFFSGNTNSTPGNEPAHTARVDYFFNNASRIDPEDPAANYLPVKIVGEGTVTKSPTCGNPVQLTAAAATGWKFAGWSGASLDGQTQPVVSTAFDRDDVVTATFVAEVFYDLQVSISPSDGSGGTVSVSPQSAQYAPGTEVTLTAAPKSGWTFAGWGGDLAGVDEATTTITIDKDTAVSATFTKESYTVAVNVQGAGRVDISPPGPYVLNQSVTLTAEPAPGFIFSSWGGDVSGTENPTTLIITGQLQVIANFEQVGESYQAFLPFAIGP